MRTISYIEKGIIDRICEGQVYISKILTDQIPDLLLNIERDNNIVELILLNGDDSKIFDKAIVQLESIIYIQSFILYLENEGFILTGHFTQSRLNHAITGKDNNIQNYLKNPEKYTKWSFPDSKTKELLLEYLDLTIFPTYHLKSFKKRKYKTIEDLRHKQTNVIAIIAISVSFLLGIISLVISYCK